MSAADVLQRIETLLRHAPEAARALGPLVDQAERGLDLYKRFHGGDAGPPGRELYESETADPAGGVVELGALVAVVYKTRKTKSGPWEDFVHDFATPRPILAFAADGSGLLILRGRSTYDVQPRGIVG